MFLPSNFKIEQSGPTLKLSTGDSEEQTINVPQLTPNDRYSNPCMIAPCTHNPSTSITCLYLGVAHHSYGNFLTWVYTFRVEFKDHKIISTRRIAERLITHYRTTSSDG